MEFLPTSKKKKKKNVKEIQVFFLK
jgi:hypothetical protein